jgi:hypothetical protein
MTTLNKTAAVLALAIGAMSIVAGGMALRGWEPGYFVLNWLPVYNFSMGVLTVFIPSILIWRESRSAMPIAIGIFGIHAIVLLVLLFAFLDRVATESILAMVFRLAIWVIILGLMFFARHRKIDLHA